MKKEKKLSPVEYAKSLPYKMIIEWTPDSIFGRSVSGSYTVVVIYNDANKKIVKQGWTREIDVVKLDQSIQEWKS